MTDWTLHREAQLAYSYERFGQAKVFVFRKWCELAIERNAFPPSDLSGSCKYGSLFMHHVFGGAIHGHYEHQYNLIGGRIVDLSHDAIDVGKIANPYLHEPDYFAIPERQASLDDCMPRVAGWVAQFLAEIERTHSGGFTMSGFFMDWDGNLRSVDDPGDGYSCVVDPVSRYVAVMKAGMLAHEGTLYKTLADVEKTGIKASLVPGSHPWGSARDGF